MKVAGGEIVWEGRTYKWGDSVPADLVAEHPEWVVDKPLTAADIAGMTEREAKAALMLLSGLISAEDAEGGAK